MSFLDDAFQSFQGVTHDATNAFGDASSTISDATTAFTDIKNIFSSPTGRTNSPTYNDPTLQLWRRIDWSTDLDGLCE